MASIPEDTLRPGSLTVATASPDPPFELRRDGFSTGFDIELMRAVCRQLELAYAPVRYTRADFNGIFDGLAARTYDAVISGTTITAERAAVALFSRPYLQFDQGVAINARLTPNISGTADLQGMTAGIQSGNTSDIVARKLLADGVLANIIYYAYDAIDTAMSDLENGRIGCVIKLAPVIAWLVKERPALTVAFTVPTHEQLGVAVAKGNSRLRDRIDAAIDGLRTSGEFAKLAEPWFPAAGNVRQR
jgi:polar amino acid transport system substrate-binding protein